MIPFWNKPICMRYFSNRFLYFAVRLKMKTILKLNNLKYFLAIFISVGLVATSNAATFDSEQMAQIESIIDEYVSNHPEVILRAMKKLEMDEKKNLEENMLNIASKVRKSDSIPHLGKGMLSTISSNL